MNDVEDDQNGQGLNVGFSANFFLKPFEHVMYISL